MTLRPEFWTKPLTSLNREEWEALCDGCAKCCLLKLEDEDTGEVAYTSITCRLLDAGTCRCGNYPLRKTLVPGCVVIDAENVEEIKDWMPATCAYRLRADSKPLPDWHPLLTGDAQSPQNAGKSIPARTTPEYEVDEDDFEDHIIEDLA